MVKFLFVLMLFASISQSVRASELSDSDDIVSSNVRDVTAEYLSNPQVNLIPNSSTPTLNLTTPDFPVSLSQLITLGEQIWKYVLDNRPSAQYQTIKTSIVPKGITSWSELSEWKMPVVKVYRVEFKNILGAASGGFDYRISFVPGGSYKGKGKFLGNITFMPLNIQLNTGRTLDVKAELSDPLNYGTTSNPVAGAQLLVSWSTPTLTHYQMDSAEYNISGDGQIQDLSTGE